MGSTSFDQSIHFIILQTKQTVSIDNMESLN